MIVRVTAMATDFATTELGTVEADDAIKLFHSHAWGVELERAKIMGATGAVCADPDMTFTALPAHLIVAARTQGSFKIEVCLPRARKLLGLFTWPKFFHFKDVPAHRVPEFIRSFCSDSLLHKYAFFEHAL